MDPIRLRTAALLLKWSIDDVVLDELDLGGLVARIRYLF
jgi:hypothetical protein